MEGGSSLRMELDVLAVSWHATAERDQDTKHAHIHGMGLEASLAEQGKCHPSQPKTVPFFSMLEGQGQATLGPAPSGLGLHCSHAPPVAGVHLGTFALWLTRLS